MKGEKNGWIRVCALMLVLLIVFCAGMHLYTHAVHEKTLNAQKEILFNAIVSAMRTCYAIEGVYPRDGDYLVEHYGLSYNQKRFHIYFDSFAENIMPDVRVIERGGEQP